MEAALPYVAKSFTDQPLIEARLRMTLGKSFWYLGDAKTALEQAEAARALYTRHLGPDHPDTLQSMHCLAVCYKDVGRLADALKLCEETLALRKVKLGPDHPDTLWSMSNLASFYDAVGRYADVLKLRQETLALRKAKLGPDHPDTLWSMSNLASCYYYLDRQAEALKLREETLTLQKAKLGPSSAASRLERIHQVDDWRWLLDRLSHNLLARDFGFDQPSWYFARSNRAAVEALINSRVRLTSSGEAATFGTSSSNAEGLVTRLS
jgi:tetratricopeptide (TPR) repeat protein